MSEGPVPGEPSGPVVAVCDANLFYSVVMTDLLLSLGSAGLFVPRWTERIHEEWVGNLLSDKPDLDPEKVVRRRGQMDAAIEDSLIEGYEHLIPGLSLPDGDDRHVLAAAIQGGAGVILTYNLRDFPPAALAGYGVAARHPDDFLSGLFGTRPAEVIDALEEMRSRKTRPALSRAELLSKLSRQRLPTFVGVLRASGYAGEETSPCGGEGTNG